MSASDSPVVSFVIPTLNRRGYVTRAVRSCLAQEDHGVRVEVIVLDSQSDDGSWEELTAEFTRDTRIKLVQNERGQGPTASWIDGAAHVTGQAVTFVWSDDYIFPGFIRSLLPPIIAGASFAFGEGLVRDVDTESVPAATEFSTLMFDAQRSSSAFLTGFDPKVGYLPASPACALFAASALRSWTERVRSFSTTSQLLSYFVWERAVGPDLLLFLIAASERGRAGTAAVVEGPVCQFSSHPGSITVSSPRWVIDVGYC